MTLRYLSLGLVLLAVLFLGWTTDASASPFAYITNSESNTVSVIDTATNTVTASVPVGSGPTGVAVHPDGTRVYVVNQGSALAVPQLVSTSNAVSVIDTAINTVIATVPVGNGQGLQGVAVNPAGTRMYVANSSSNTVSVIDTTANNVVIAAIPVENEPRGVAVHPAGTRVYVANRLGNSVSVIDTATNTVTAIVPVGVSPQGLAVNPVGTRVYVANGSSNTISVIDTATNAVTATVPVENGPRGVAVNPAGTRVYVTNAGTTIPIGITIAGNTVSVIDTESNAVITKVTVGNSPQGVVVDPTGTRLYVANADSNTVSVIDAGSNSVTTTVPVMGRPVAFGQFVGPAVSDVRPSPCPAPCLYVSNSKSNTVSVIDTASNALRATVTVGNGPRGVAVSPTGTRVYVTNLRGNTVSVIDTATNTVTAVVPVDLLPSGVAVDPRGTRVYVTSLFSNTLSVIDVATNKVSAKVPVGLFPNSVAVHPDGTKVYVTNSGANTISVVDTATNTAAAPVPTRESPIAVTVNPTGTLVYAITTASFASPASLAAPNLATIGALASARPPVNNVLVLDALTTQFTSTVPIGRIAGQGVTMGRGTRASVIETTTARAAGAQGSCPQGVAVLPSGTRAYVPIPDSNTVSVVDTATNTERARVPVGNGPVGAAVTPDGTKAYVANSGDNTVSVLDTNTNTPTATLPPGSLGDSPTCLGVSPASLEAFVEGLYQHVLDRPPDGPGRADHTNFLKGNCHPDGFRTTGERFYGSDEFLTRKRLTLIELGTRAYRAFLGRNPDDGGLAALTNSFREVHLGIARIFLSSLEFQNRRPDLSNRAAVTDFLTRLYRKILGREPDSGGLSGFVDQILRTGDETAVVMDLLNSKEFQDRPLFFRDYVSILYQALLVREPDAGGLQAHEGALRAHLPQFFIPSGEFRLRIVQLCPGQVGF